MGIIPAPLKMIMKEVKNEKTWEIKEKWHLENINCMSHDQSLVAYITFKLSDEVLANIDDELTVL